MALLKYNEWNSLNEGKLIDKIKDWLSGNFGGDIGKLNDILEDYRRIELRFVDEWERIKIEIDKLELQRAQTKSDPAELKKIDRMMERNRDLVSSAQKVHEKRTDELFIKAKKIIDSNKRALPHWESKKAAIDSEVAEEMYRRSKKLADESTSTDLYYKYREAVTKAKEKDRQYLEMYGNMLDSTDKLYSRYSKDPASGKKYSDSNFEVFSKLSAIEFSEAIKDFPKEELKQLTSYLIKERNDLYVAMEIEKETLLNQVQKMPKDNKTKEFSAEKLKEINQKYMSRIRELRSKITLSRRNA